MRVLSPLILLIFPILFWGAELKAVLNVEGAVTDMIYRSGKLYVATELGKIEVFELDRRERTVTFELPKVRDFTGELIPPKIFSVELFPDSDRLLLVVQGSSGYRELFLVEDGRLRKILDSGKRLMINEARLVSPDKALLSLVSDELLLLDLNKGSEIYRVQVGMSSLSDIQLNESRDKVAVSDESGVVSIVSTADGKVLKRLSGINVDKLYKLDYRRDTIMVGGRDRRVGLYFLRDGSKRRIDAEFLVFTVALSEDAKLGAFPYNEDNDVKIIETRSGRVVEVLRGQKSTVSVLLFLKGNLLVGCEDGRILVWSLN